MNRYRVTFKFKNCSPTVEAMGNSEDEAVESARHQDHPPVHPDTEYTVELISHGGRRKGAGNPGTQRTKKPKDTRKMVNLTKEQFKKVKAEQRAGESVSKLLSRLIFEGWEK